MTDMDEAAEQDEKDKLDLRGASKSCRGLGAMEINRNTPSREAPRLQVFDDGMEATLVKFSILIHLIRSSSTNWLN